MPHGGLRRFDPIGVSSRLAAGRRDLLAATATMRFSVKSRGLFITFEGIDGSGKTTQMHRLADRLRALGRTVLETVEPGGPPIAAKIRRILLDSANQELSPTTELLLYFASRAQNVDEWIQPALERGEIVLSDRFTDSSLVYQGAGRGLGAETVKALDRIACRDRKS